MWESKITVPVSSTEKYDMKPDEFDFAKKNQLRNNLLGVINFRMTVVFLEILENKFPSREGKKRKNVQIMQ